LLSKRCVKKSRIHPGSEPNGFGKVVAVDIRSYAHVLEIIWDEENKKENIAIGVRYFCNGTVREAFITPKGEVIICSGATGRLPQRCPKMHLLCLFQLQAKKTLHSL
jgi:hypothetical protein